MKGFARILEAIIASVIVLAALTFFFVPDPTQSKWDSAALQVTTQDTLKALYLNGTLERFVKTDNRTHINDDLANMLPKTTDFSIEVSGIPNDIIYISCVDCPSLDGLNSILAPLNFQYKNRNISIRADILTLGNTSVPAETNILFFFDKEKIIEHQPKLNGFISSGGSVFLLSDLIQTDVDGIIGDIFNLTWIGTTTQEVVFDDIFNTSKISHYAGRYFANITGEGLENTSSISFPVNAAGFHQNGVLADIPSKNVAITSDGRAYVRANFTAVNNGGRTVWFADYNRANHDAPVTKSIDNLLKASIMWSSGERFKLDIISKQSAQIHFKAGIFIFDEDPYLVELTVWNIFF